MKRIFKCITKYVLFLKEMAIMPCADIKLKILPYSTLHNTVYILMALQASRYHERAYRYTQKRTVMHYRYWPKTKAKRLVRIGLLLCNATLNS